jgi:hypothetical protein
MTIHRTNGALVMLGACALLIGCGGSHMPAAGGFAPGSTSMQNPADRGRDHRGCTNDGDVHVTPCRVTFDTKRPGPAQVVVTRDGEGDRNGHAIKERDDCAAGNIATVSRDSNRLYTVTAGSAAGTCTARFSDSGNRNDDGSRNGGAVLRIANRL